MPMVARFRVACLAVISIALATVPIIASHSAQAVKPVEIRIGVINRKVPPPALYELDPVPQDEAVAGARLAIDDDNTTGRFTGQHYSLDGVTLDKDQSPVDAARKLVDDGANFIAADLPADELVAVADAVKDRHVIVFNSPPRTTGCAVRTAAPISFISHPAGR